MIRPEHRRGKFLVLDDIVFELGDADLPGAVRLIADVPELYAVRLRMSVSRPLGAPIGRCRSIDIFDLFGGGVCVAQAGIHGDIGFGPDKFGEIEPFVHADVIGLHGVPGVVEHGFTPVARPDGGMPVPVG